MAGRYDTLRLASVSRSTMGVCGQSQCSTATGRWSELAGACVVGAGFYLDDARGWEGHGPRGAARIRTAFALVAVVFF
jgi:predicted nucleic acid-binding Zn ribbon protein